ncbi:MAG: ATP-grasp domain-containing protein [Polyangiaceae bacterium]|nr:ATP-grasp domain-containing protein [Polyangiaceae bacterium]
MRKYRVIVLMHEDLVPPESTDGYSDKEIAEWATEYDVVAGLQKLGHEVYMIGVGSDLGAIRAAFAETRAHVAFNLLVHFHGVAVYDQHVVSYIELLRKAYTGCNPRGLLLARDKALSKRLLAAHRIRVPKFQVFPRGRRARRAKHLDFPLVVKSVNEEASLGISQSSVVTNDQKLVERVAFMHETFGVDVIVEEFIEGRELYLGVMGNQRLQTLPVWELPFDELPEGVPHIATAKLKWDLDYQQKYHIRTQRARDLSPEQEAEIAHLGKRIYRALSLSGYARIDLRLANDGRVYVLEANPNPDLKYGEDFAESAHAAGIAYPELLQRLLTLGLSYQAEWKRNDGD